MTIETGICLAGLDPMYVAIATIVTVTVTHEEVILGPITDPYATVHHIIEAEGHTVTNETSHRADPHHAEIFPETAVDLDHVHDTNTTTKHQQDHLSPLIKQPGKPNTGNISRSPLMIHNLSIIALMSKPVTQKMI